MVVDVGASVSGVGSGGGAGVVLCAAVAGSGCGAGSLDVLPINTKRRMMNTCMATLHAPAIHHSVTLSLSISIFKFSFEAYGFP